MTCFIKKSFYTAAGRLRIGGLRYGLEERKESNGVEVVLTANDSAFVVRFYHSKIGSALASFKYINTARTCYDNWGGGFVDVDQRFFKTAKGNK